jgi:hypothetical protein
MKSESWTVAKFTTHNAIQSWPSPLLLRRKQRMPRGGHLNNPFNPKIGEAVLGFNSEAVLYCDGISDAVARDYAIEYARMIQQRATGNSVQFPRIPSGLFGPNCSLIRSKLEGLSEKYFPRK